MQKLARNIVGWLDSSTLTADLDDPASYRTDPVRWIPYIILHAGCLGVIWVGWSWTAVGVAAALYVLRMFAVTGFYHRYFSHRTFRTSRAFQLVMAMAGNSSAQRGPMWWAAQHRRHHSHSDQPEDPHSPVEHGLYWSHAGWLTARANLVTDLRVVRDLAQFPELRFLDRFDWLVPLAMGFGLYWLGAGLEAFAPQLGTSGWQMVVWGFFISTVVLFHATCMINSLAHVAGSRRFETNDDSRNNWLLALLTLGEGWHNNHHHYPSSVRQGFYWWEIDPTYYGLRILAAVGLIWDLRAVPQRVLASGRRDVRRAA